MTAEHAQRDLIRVIDDMPVVFTWEGAEYVGTRGALVKGERLVEGGIFSEPELTITTCLKKKNLSGALVDRFPSGSKPAVSDKFQNVGDEDGVDFRIERVTEDELSAGIQFDLVSVDK